MMIMSWTAQNGMQWGRGEHIDETRLIIIWQLSKVGDRYMVVHLFFLHSMCMSFSIEKEEKSKLKTQIFKNPYVYLLCSF